MADLETSIRNRRTHKRFNGEALGRDAIEPLLELAIHAPMHRLTNPWRFRVLTQDRFGELAAWLQGEAGEQLAARSDDPAKALAKMGKFVSHYLSQLGAIVQVTSLRSDDPCTEAENRDAVAAAVQNLLLAAEAAGLAAFWSSSVHLRQPETLTWFGSDPASEQFVASIWLGGAVEPPKAPQRLPLAEVASWR